MASHISAGQVRCRHKPGVLGLAEAVLLCGLLTVSGCGGGEHETAGTGADAGTRARQLFELSRRTSDVSLENRMAAAAELAKLPEGEKWVIVVLLDRTALAEGAGPAAGENSGRGERLETFDSAVVASMLEALPDNASCEVLWAATSRLSDTSEGRYSLEDRFCGVRVRWISCSTPPIRKVAQEALVRATGVDYGYDIDKWRHVLLRKEVGRMPGGVPTPQGTVPRSGATAQPAPKCAEGG